MKIQHTILLLIASFLLGGCSGQSSPEQHINPSVTDSVETSNDLAVLNSRQVLGSEGRARDTATKILGAEIKQNCPIFARRHQFLLRTEHGIWHTLLSPTRMPAWPKVSMFLVVSLTVLRGARWAIWGLPREH